VEQSTLQVQGYGKFPQHRSKASTECEALTKETRRTQRRWRRRDHELDAGAHDAQGQLSGGDCGADVAAEANIVQLQSTQ
jgi:hypothetical protein